MGAISSLQQQVQSLLAELNAVREEIHKFKLGEANMISSSSSHLLLPSSVAVSIAAPPPPTLPMPPLPSTSSIYNPQQTPTNYNSISSDHITYFD